MLIAYTHYAFFEWALIFLDVLYDGVTEGDFLRSNIQVCPFALVSFNEFILLFLDKCLARRYEASRVYEVRSKARIDIFH